MCFDKCEEDFEDEYFEEDVECEDCEDCTCKKTQASQ